MTKNKLTLFIFIALVAGVITGYIYNEKVIDKINTSISLADAQIKVIDTRLVEMKDTTVDEFKVLKLQRALQMSERKKKRYHARR